MTGDGDRTPPQTHMVECDLHQEVANLTAVLDYMENTNARQFDPSRVVVLVSLVRDRMRDTLVSEVEG